MGATIDKILCLLEGRGMNQSELESRAGLAKNRIAVLKSRGKLTAAEAFRIARALGVRVEYLLDDAIRDVRPDYTEQEQDILKMSRIIGYEEAKRRLMEARGPVVESEDLYGKIRARRPPGEGGKRPGA